MMKRLLTATALAAVLAAPAFAQQPTPKSDMAAPSMAAPSSATSQPGFVQTQNANEWRGSKLIGANVYGPDNTSIGEINDVLIAGDGRVQAAVVGVGGFLGVGEKNVAVPFDALVISRKPNSSSIEKISVSFTKDQLKNAPKFAYYEAPASQTTGSGVGSVKSMTPATEKTSK